MCLEVCQHQGAQQRERERERGHIAHVMLLLQKATDLVEEFPPFGTAASSNGALPTPPGLSQYSSLLCDVGRKTKGQSTDSSSAVALTRIMSYADGRRDRAAFFVNCNDFVDELHEIPISVAITVLEGVGALLLRELLGVRDDQFSRIKVRLVAGRTCLMFVVISHRVKPDRENVTRSETGSITYGTNATPD